MRSDGEQYEWPEWQRVVRILHARKYQVAKRRFLLLQPRPDRSETGCGNVKGQKTKSKEPGLPCFLSQFETRAWAVQSGIDQRRYNAQNPDCKCGVAEPITHLAAANGHAQTRNHQH